MGKNRIFMLDDDTIILSLYRDLLESRGYDVFTTTNAYKFLLYAKELAPDIFILDVNMPELGGWEVVNLLNKDEKFQNIPVIMLTVVSEHGLSVAKGVAHYLNKPTDSEKILDIIDSYCKGNKEHDLLLVNDYEPMFSTVKEAIKDNKFSYFEVHDVNAANVYLDKNRPQIVCVKFEEKYYEAAKNKLHHDKIYFVKDKQSIDNLRDIIK